MFNYWLTIRKQKHRPGVVHTCQLLVLWEAEAGWSLEVRSSRPAWPTWWNPISTKNTKISQVWWQEPIIPATREAEAGESCEDGKWRLQWAKIAALHSSLSNRVRLSQRSQNKTTKQTKKTTWTSQHVNGKYWPCVDHCWRFIIFSLRSGMWEFPH